ncbi:flagellar biosynthetic protein FliO [Telmatospirillum sp. J64-1]|uniref:FliO/MopB family protein n=1 Tax=Telmatospirillum sp. J64-1 TaxID=2502183 RepID=UPI00115CA653|nr:flagellar biosynthetic protein FliO [Telmatospirillum sp. J64-1]
MDLDTYMRFMLALVFVLGLITVAAWAARRFGMGPRLAGGGKRKRLALVETMMIDGKRRLVLVRRDDKEHLLLIGGGNDVVVEQGITDGFRASLGGETAAKTGDGE